MTLKIIIYSVGKSKESWLQEALSEYEKRLRPQNTILWKLAKDQDQLRLWLASKKDYICLNPSGESMTSIEFSKLFATLPMKKTFVIGNAEGIHKEIINRASQQISLSQLTFTHQMTRLILIEQIYRAIEIDRGSKYHK